MTIEQLAYASGMSVRNIRNHQSSGLLPAPEVRARTGYYGQLHLERLRLVQQMQAEGFKLTAIKRLIGMHGSDADRVVGLRRLVTTPEQAEAPEVYTRDELTARFGEENSHLIAQAEKMQLLVDIGYDRYEAPSPSLLRAAEAAQGSGVPLEVALATVSKVRRSTQAIAKEFVEMFLEEIWKPFAEAGRPEDRWDEVIAAIEGLRPIASEAVVSLFRQVLAAEIEDTFGKELERQGKTPQS